VSGGQRQVEDATPTQQCTMYAFHVNTKQQLNRQQEKRHVNTDTNTT